jgi:hypothetical protein
MRATVGRRDAGCRRHPQGPRDQAGEAAELVLDAPDDSLDEDDEDDEDDEVVEEAAGVDGVLDALLDALLSVL